MGVWYNITDDVKCYDFKSTSAKALADTISKKSSGRWTDPASEICTSTVKSVAACWDPICCNENLRLINTELTGVGNDMFWPPNIERGWTFDKLVESAGTAGSVWPYHCLTDNW